MNLLENFKYFKNEKENPFKGTDQNSAMWWDGERELFNRVENDPKFWDKLEKQFDRALENRGLSGILVDETVKKEKRMVIFFLDLWHGKWLPFDDLDAIKDY